jgi:transcriptional regulator with XRE-family HTH domain
VNLAHSALCHSDLPAKVSFRAIGRAWRLLELSYSSQRERDSFISMLIGKRWREFRWDKSLSLADLENRTGICRRYISDVENGRVVPHIETLVKFALGLELPVRELFYNGENPPKLLKLPKEKSNSGVARNGSQKEAKWIAKFECILSEFEPSDRKPATIMVRKMVRARPK